MRRLDEAGLTTREACGNSVRNVTACELAEVCADAAFDVTPYAEAIVAPLPAPPALEQLAAQVQDRLQRLRHRLRVRGHPRPRLHRQGAGRRARASRCYAAGGLSTTPQAAITLHEFVPAGGDRPRRGGHRAAVPRAGQPREQGPRAPEVRPPQARRAGLPREVRRAEGARSTPRRWRSSRCRHRAENAPAPPVAWTAAAPRRRATSRGAARSVVDQRQDGYAAVYVRLFLGDVTSAQMRALGGDRSPLRRRDAAPHASTRTSLIPWVDSRSLPALFAALARDRPRAQRRPHGARRDVVPGRRVVQPRRDVVAQRRPRHRRAARAADDVGALAGLADTTIKIQRVPQLVRPAPRRRHRLARRGEDRRTARPTRCTSCTSAAESTPTGARFGRQVVKVVARRVPEAVAAAARSSSRPSGRTARRRRASSGASTPSASSPCSATSPRRPDRGRRDRHRRGDGLPGGHRRRGVRGVSDGAGGLRARERAPRARDAGGAPRLRGRDAAARGCSSRRRSARGAASSSTCGAGSRPHLPVVFIDTGLSLRRDARLPRRARARARAPRRDRPARGPAGRLPLGARRRHHGARPGLLLRAATRSPRSQPLHRAGARRG